MWQLINDSLRESLMLIITPAICSVLVGLPLAVVLWSLTSNNLSSNQIALKLLKFIVNTLGTVPFLVLMMLLMPVSQWFASITTVSSTWIAIVPLTIAMIPLVTNGIYQALTKLPTNIAEMSRSLGASSWQTITRVLLPEALPNIIIKVSETFTTLIGFSTIAGAFGAGGLGYLAIQKGYQQFDFLSLLMISTILICLSYIFKYSGILIAQFIAKR